MGPELLIPLVAPIVTELLKKLLGLVFNDVPPLFSPLLSAAAGGAIGVIPGMESTLLKGVELGLAGVGVHQTARVAGLTTRHARSRAADRG